MYRAVNDFDGDDPKCISLKYGDRLTDAFILDDLWYIGHNQRTKKTGAFPISCVVADEHFEEIPTSTPDSPPIAIPASSSAANESATSPETPDVSTLDSAVGDKMTELLHSVSVSESCTDWHESFESSFHHENENSGNVINPATISEASHVPADDDNQADDRVGADNDVGEIMTTFTILLYAPSIMSALLFIGISFLSLVYVYRLPIIAVVVITAVATICMVVFYVFVSAFKCIISLWFPSGVSSVGQAVLYGMLLCLILTGPVLNITKNLKQAGSNMACAIDLMAHQQEALQRKSHDLADGLMKHMEQQQETLTGIYGNISSDFDGLESTLSIVDAHLDKLIENMTAIYEDCSKPFDNAKRVCLNTCSQFPDENLKLACEDECKKIDEMSSLCNDLNIGGNIADASAKSKIILERAKVNLKIDMSVKMGNNATNNATSSGVCQAVDEVIELSTRRFEDFITAILVCLSPSLLVLLIRAFTEYRRYLSNDAYNNVFITSRFREFDSTTSNNVLPLKENEKNVYVDKTCMSLPNHQNSCFRHGTVLFVHVCVLTFFVLLDYTLYYVLITTRQLVYHAHIPEHSRNFNINVNGVGPVALFYINLFKGIALYDDFLTKVRTIFYSCNLPPTSPIDAYNIAGFVVLYLVLICAIALPGCAKRLQEIVLALHYPSEEKERMEYLREKIRAERDNHAAFFPQMVRSRHKEMLKTLEFSLRNILMTRVTFLQKCLKTNVTSVCIGCGGSDGHLVTMYQCYCSPDTPLGEILYCEECKRELNDQCPICVIG